MDGYLANHRTAVGTRMNEVFKALADPTRREILRLLRGGEMTAGELASRFEMSKPSVSHHFTVLKQADLIGSRREGQQIYYFLNTTVMQDVLAMMWALFGTDEPETKKAEG
jgi:ArsR family transcriptional regulator